MRTAARRWPPWPVWRHSLRKRGCACGAAASGNFHAVWNLFGDAPTTDSWGVVGTDTVKAIGAMRLSGPILCGFTQTINDWYDRDLDAIQAPAELTRIGRPEAVTVQFRGVCDACLIKEHQHD